MDEIVVCAFPEEAGRFEELAGHEVGQVGCPELGDGDDVEATGCGHADVPAGEMQGLFREVQMVDVLVGLQ